MTTKFDARQSVSRDLLDQIATSVGVDLEVLIRSINSELTPVLRMDVAGPLLVSVGPNSKTNSDTDRNVVAPPIDGQIPSFTLGTISFPAMAGGTITVTPGDDETLTLSNDNYIKVGVNLLSSGDLKLTFGAEAITEDNATVPPLVPNSVALGYITIFADSGGNIQTLTTDVLYKYTHLVSGADANANQDRNLKLIGGGTWTWDEATEFLSWDANAYIQVAGLTDNRNQINPGNSLLLPGRVLYVTLNRSNDTPTILTALAAEMEDLPSSNDTYVIARRDGNDVVVGASFRLKDGEKLELDGALAEINRRLNQLKITQNTTNLDEVDIGDADIAQLDGSILSQELSNVLMNFPGANINFTTGTVTGAPGTNFTPFSVPVGEYFWYGVALTANAVGLDNRIDANVIVTPGSNSDPVQGDAPFPLLLGTKKLGAVQVYNNAGNIEVVEVRRLGVGSGSGSGDGSGGGAPVEPADGFQMAFVDDFGDTPTSSASMVRDGETNANHSVPNKLYRLSCDKTRTVSTTGTAYTLSGAASFTVQAGDIIWINNQSTWRRIASVSTSTTGTLDAAFPSNAAGATCMVSQAVWTKDIVNNAGDAAETTRPRDFFPNTAIQQVNVDYFDSLAAADDTPDYIDEARVVVAVSQEGVQADTNLPLSNEFSPIYTRAQAPGDVSNYVLNTLPDEERLFLVFFCNPANVSVTSGANLLKYMVSFYEQEILVNGGVLEYAFAMSQASGTPINCSNIALESGVSTLTLDWAYVPDVNTGTGAGDLTVIVNGQFIPRRVVGSTQDAYYTEEPGNNRKIRFWADLSVTDVSIEVTRRQGSIDTSDENKVELAQFHVPQIVSGAVTLDQKKYQRIITTTGGYTIDLPASPRQGDIVMIKDGAGTWASSNVTVGRNGNNIQGVAANDVLDIDDGWVEYEYYDNTQGWLVRV
jgi:hypothetical protein